MKQSPFVEQEFYVISIRKAYKANPLSGISLAFLPHSMCIRREEIKRWVREASIGGDKREYPHAPHSRPSVPGEKRHIDRNPHLSAVTAVHLISNMKLKENWGMIYSKRKSHRFTIYKEIAFSITVLLVSIINQGMHTKLGENEWKSYCEQQNTCRNIHNHKEKCFYF